MTLTLPERRRIVLVLLIVPALLGGVMCMWINAMLTREISEFIDVNRWQPLADLPEAPGRLLYDHDWSIVWFEGSSGTKYQYRYHVTTDVITESWSAPYTIGHDLDRCEDQSPTIEPVVPPPAPVRDSFTCFEGVGDITLPTTYAVLQDGRAWRIVHYKPIDWAAARLFSFGVGLLVGLCGGALPAGIMWQRGRRKAQPQTL